MKNKISKISLCCYDLFLSIGAIYYGTLMIIGKFTEYPSEWLTRVPFTNWFYPGIIAIVIFGIGNFIAVIFCLTKNNKYIIVSAVMGAILLLSLLISILVLGNIYLATIEFIVLGIIQLILTIFNFRVFFKHKYTIS